MQGDARRAGFSSWYSREAQRGVDELESLLDSDYLSYLHPQVIASMKRLIARNRAMSESSEGF